MISLAAESSSTHSQLPPPYLKNSVVENSLNTYEKKSRNFEVSLAFFKVAILCLNEMKNQKMFNKAFKKLIYFGYGKNYFLLYLLCSMFDSVTTTLVEIAWFYVLFSIFCCSSSCLVLDWEFLLK